MTTEQKVNAAAWKLSGDVAAIAALLDELVTVDTIHFDDEGNPYWETCGEPVQKGIELVFHDE